MSNDPEEASTIDPLAEPPASPDPIVQWQPAGRRLGARPGVAVGGVAGVVLVAGSLALGALAIGALAVGALAIGSLAVGKARIRRLEIDELVVRRMVGSD